MSEIKREIEVYLGVNPLSEEPGSEHLVAFFETMLKGKSFILILQQETPRMKVAQFRELYPEGDPVIVDCTNVTEFAQGDTAAFKVILSDRSSIEAYVIIRVTGVDTAAYQVAGTVFGYLIPDKGEKGDTGGKGDKGDKGDDGSILYPAFFVNEDMHLILDSETGTNRFVVDAAGHLLVSY